MRSKIATWYQWTHFFKVVSIWQYLSLAEIFSLDLNSTEKWQIPLSKILYFVRRTGLLADAKCSMSEKYWNNGKYTTYDLLLGQYVLHVSTPNPHALSESLYRVSLNYFKHIEINSSAGLGNSLPKIFIIVPDFSDTL
jgi:hypothetical protein